VSDDNHPLQREVSEKEVKPAFGCLRVKQVFFSLQGSSFAVLLLISLFAKYKR
jgi:hypothetical protein